MKIDKCWNTKVVDKKKKINILILFSTTMMSRGIALVKLPINTITIQQLEYRIIKEPKCSYSLQSELDDYRFI